MGTQEAELSSLDTSQPTHVPNQSVKLSIQSASIEIDDDDPYQVGNPNLVDSSRALREHNIGRGYHPARR